MRQISFLFPLPCISKDVFQTFLCEALISLRCFGVAEDQASRVSHAAAPSEWSAGSVRPCTRCHGLGRAAPPTPCLLELARDEPSWRAAAGCFPTHLLAGVVSVPSWLLSASAPPFASRRVAALPQLMQTGVKLLGGC